MCTIALLNEAKNCAPPKPNRRVAVPSRQRPPLVLEVLRKEHNVRRCPPNLRFLQFAPNSFVSHGAPI